MGLFQGDRDIHHCRKCEHWGVSGGFHALCVRGGGTQVTALPQNGCAFRVRAIGADDAEPPQDKRKKR